MRHFVSALRAMEVALLLFAFADPAGAASVTLDQPASTSPTSLTSADGDVTYTVNGCTYGNTAAADSTTSVAGQAATVASGTACITALGLQMVQSGADGVTFSSTTVNPLVAVATDTDFTDEADAQIVLNVAITGNGSISFTGLTGTTSTGLSSGTGIAGASIVIADGATLNPTSANGDTQNTNFANLETLNLTITASAYASGALSGASLTSFDLTPNDVPEPAGTAVCLVGVLALATLRRRRLPAPV